MPLSSKVKTDQICTKFVSPMPQMIVSETNFRAQIRYTELLVVVFYCDNYI